MLNLLNNDDSSKPKICERKSCIRYTFNFDGDEVDSGVVDNLRKDLQYIKAVKNNDKKREIVHIQIFTKKFKDKCVVVFIESLIYSLLKYRELELYINIKELEKHLVEYNYYEYSILNEFNRKQINSYTYCEKFEKSSFKTNSMRWFLSQTQQIKPEFVSNRETDISCMLHHTFNDAIVDSTSSVIGELADNIITHTDGYGVIDFEYTKIVRASDNTEYYLFIICIVNFSKNKLYTNMEKGFSSNSLGSETTKILSDAYKNQMKHFNDEDYNAELFFMVSAFQKGTTTRTATLGGTGLNSMLRTLAKNALDDSVHYKSYVYSGNKILVFDAKALKEHNVFDNIAFNKKNDFNCRPDPEFIMSSMFNFDGTAYNLVFIVEEKDLK